MKTLNIKKLQRSVNIYIFFSMTLVLLLSLSIILNHEHHFIIILVISILFILLLVLKKIENYQKNVELEYERKLNELQDTRNMYQDLFDTTPNIMATIYDLTIVNANRAMLDFLDYNSLDDFLSEHKCICDFFEEENECLGEKVDGMNWFEYVEKNPDKLHKVSMYKNGNKHFFVVRSKKLSYGTNNAFLIVLSDITELELSRERYTFALNATNDGLWDLNLLNNELYLSDNWKKQLGYESYELKDSQGIWGDLIHPDDKINSRQEFTNNIYGNTEFYESIYRLKHKDGRWVWILDRGKTIYDSDGKAIRMIGTHTDISKIKELEEDLKRQKNLFELFMKNIPAYVSIKDKSAKLTYANPLTKQLLDDMNMRDKELEEYLDEESVNKIKYLDEQTYIHGKCEDIINISTPDGNKHYRIIKFIIENSDNKKQIASLAFDITKDYENQQKLMNQQEVMIAQSRHAALGEMISMIAHQWRQPISIIAMEANNMLVDIALDSLDNKVSELYANNILYQTQELSNTIDDFRNFFKPVKIREHVKLKDIFDDVVSIIGKSFESNKIDMALKIDDSIELYTFTRELMQVLINILKNSKESLIEHNKENPAVKVLTEEKDNMINIEICDNGPGIDKKIIDKIFEPYFSTKDQNGTGLGLYMSKTIIEDHLKGSLDVKNIENGVCFYISVPSIKPEEKN